MQIQEPLKVKGLLNGVYAINIRLGIEYYETIEDR